MAAGIMWWGVFLIAEQQNVPGKGLGHGLMTRLS
jgi:hypothetical protein